MVKALVIRAAGTNCEQELLRAFTLAGAAPTLAHLDRVIRDPGQIDDFDLIGFPGGFSYGDDIASGRIFAMRVRERLYPRLRAAVERGCPIIGVCNGFQVLVQVGLLPGPPAGSPWPDSAPEQRASLAENIDARFVDRWVPVEFDRDSVCVWTRGIADCGLGIGDCKSDGVSQSAIRNPQSEILQLPVAHGEGRFVGAPGVIEELQRAGQVALRYLDNYNGSERSIAGICDSTGLVFGLMPHPERYLDWTRHPYWTRLPERVTRAETPGLRLFRNAVAAAERSAARAAV